MSDLSLLKRLADLIEGGTACALATIVRAHGGTPNVVGAKMIVGADGSVLAGTIGGGTVEHHIQQRAAAAIAEGPASFLFDSKLTETEHGGIGMLCGGRVEVYVEVHQPATRLVLVGGGHVNLAVARLARELDLRVTVVDDRPEWANPTNYPGASLVHALPEDALPTLNIDAQTFIVIATPDRDGPALAAAARTPARYIGMVAARRKAITLLKALPNDVDVDALLPRLHAPIGLAIGGRTPADVALSAVAEIQAERHGRELPRFGLTLQQLKGYASAASDARS